jgi:hypothetical protein
MMLKRVSSDCQFRRKETRRRMIRQSILPSRPSLLSYLVSLFLFPVPAAAVSDEGRGTRGKRRKTEEGAASLVPDYDSYQ